MSKNPDVQNTFPEFNGYQILGLIGEGGMGKVFKALDLNLQRTVAIKLLNEGSGSENEQPDNGKELAEARRLAKLNHPNIVQVYELRNDNNNSAIVMEYLAGSTLREYNKQRLMPLAEKLDVLKQIAAGMEYVHQHQLLHADLKPENVFVTEQQQVKILDFGIARDLQNSEQHSPQLPEAALMTSLNTLSPELLAGKSHTTTSDIYAFGNLAFWLLTGQSPAAGHTTAEKVASIKTGKLQKASQLVPELPVILSDFLQYTLAFDASQRPADFAAIGVMLQRIQQQLFSQSPDDENTRLLQELAPEQTARSGLLSLKLWLPALLALVVLMILAVNWFAPPDKTSTHFVLVLKPRITANSDMAPERQKMVSAVIDNALRNAVLNTRSLNLIAKSEFIDTQASSENLAKITGATDIVQSLLNCSAQYCEVTFERLDASASQVLQRFNWHLPVDSAIDISQASSQHLLQLFPGKEEQYLPDYPVSEQDFAEYIDIYQSLELQVGDTHKNYLKLVAFIAKQPNIWLSYRLLRTTAMKLYLDSGDSQYLADLESILLQAPPEYRSSLFYTWDAFLLALYQQNFEHAQSLLEQAEKRSIDPTTLAELRATYFLQSNQPDKAKTLYEFALNTRFSTINLYNLTLCHWHLGEKKQAKQRLQQMLEIVPNDYGAQQLLASIHLLSGELSSAITLYKALIKNTPESRDLSNLSIALLLSGDLEQARLFARDAVNLSPENTTWLLNLADIEKLSGNKAFAAQLYDAVVDKTGNLNDLDSLLIKAQAYIHKGQPVMAIKALNQANRLSPDNGEVKFISALIYAVQGENASAVVKIEEAMNAGVGAIWFSLPWFKPLCSESDFIALMQPHKTIFDGLCFNPT